MKKKCTLITISFEGNVGSNFFTYDQPVRPFLVDNHIPKAGELVVGLDTEGCQIIRTVRRVGDDRVFIGTDASPYWTFDGCKRVVATPDQIGWLNNESVNEGDTVFHSAFTDNDTYKILDNQGICFVEWSNLSDHPILIDGRVIIHFKA